MQRFGRLKSRNFPFLGLGIIILLAAVACGTAATATPEATAPEATPTPATTEQETDAPEAMAATPTPAPMPADAVQGDAAQQVEKFTIMQASLGNEIFNPRMAQGENNLWQRLSQAWLIGTNRDLKLDTTTGIASDWKLTDDGMGWEFTIKEGLKFHNGDEITVEDVAFSQDWTLSEQSVSVSIVRLARQVAERPKVTGPNSFKVVFKQPLAFYPTAVSEIDNLATGTVISKSYWDSVAQERSDGCVPVEYCRGEFGFEENPAPGTAGPFRLVNHLPSEEMLFERFDDYFAKDQRLYPFEQVSLRLVPELSTRVAALQAGAADIIEADLSVVDQIRSGGGQIITSPQAVYIWISVSDCHQETDSQGNPIMCHDKRIREALDYAIDKTKVQALYGGPEIFEIRGTPTVCPSCLGYSEGLDPFPYDPDKARQLLADAGYPNGEGFNGGRPLNVHTWTGAGAPLTVEMSTLVCNMWEKELNIDCEVNVGEEVALKDRQYSGQIPGEFIVRTNEHTFDGGRRLLGRYGMDGYLTPDPEILNLVQEALAVVGTQEERASL
jgi:peptide/nickel transport system substrate-binding protein